MSENVTPFPERETSADAGARRLAVVAAIWRVWTPHLLPSEERLLVRVIDQTLFMTRKPERLMTDEFLYTGRFANGTQVIAPLGLSRRTFYNAKKRLIELKLIEVDPVKQNGGAVWRVLSDHIMSGEKHVAKLCEKAGGLKKTVSKSAKSAPMGCRNYTVRGCKKRTADEKILHPTQENFAPMNQVIETGNKNPLARDPARSPGREGISLSVRERTRAVHDAAASIAEVARAAAERHQAKVQERAAKAAAKPKRSMFDLEVIWRAAHAETYPHAPGCLPWSKVDAGRVKQLAASFPADRDFAEFLAHAVRHWRDICRDRIVGLKDPAPDRPTVGFLIAFKHHFDADFTEGGIRFRQQAEGKYARAQTQVRRSLDHQIAKQRAAVGGRVIIQQVRDDDDI